MNTQRIGRKLLTALSLALAVTFALPLAALATEQDANPALDVIEVVSATETELVSTVTITNSGADVVALVDLVEGTFFWMEGDSDWESLPVAYMPADYPAEIAPGDTIVLTVSSDLDPDDGAAESPTVAVELDEDDEESDEMDEEDEDGDDEDEDEDDDEDEDEDEDDDEDDDDDDDDDDDGAAVS
jgi:hypothetical protein